MALHLRQWFSNGGSAKPPLTKKATKFFFFFFVATASLEAFWLGTAEMFSLLHKMAVKLLLQFYIICMQACFFHACILEKQIQKQVECGCRYVTLLKRDCIMYWQAVQTELKWHFCLTILCKVAIKGTCFTPNIVLVYTPPLPSLQVVPITSTNPQGVPDTSMAENHGSKAIIGC